MTTQRMISATRASDLTTIYIAVNSLILIQAHGTGSLITVGPVKDEREEQIIVTDSPATLYALANT